MQNDESIRDKSIFAEIPSAQGAGILVGIAFVLLAMLEVDFLSDLYALYIRHSLTESLVAAVGFQLGLIIVGVCSWRLWKRKFIVQFKGASQNWSNMYLSLLMIFSISSALLFSSIRLAVFKAHQILVP